MKIYAISPEELIPDEARIISELLHEGLEAYHLRKPSVSKRSLANFLNSLPKDARSRIVLHQHYSLVREFGLAGYHLKDTRQVERERRQVEQDGRGGKTLSRSIHEIDPLVTLSAEWNYVFLSPVFHSISKPGYESAWSASDLTAALAQARPATRTEFCALGGIDAERARRAKGMGFDAIVLHGALWQSEQPMHTFNEIREVVR